MKVFISYRRQDSEWVTLSLFNLLKQQMPNDDIFKDFNVIKPGDDFTKAIDKNLNSCDVLLVVIGEQWLNCKNEAGMQRIFETADYVAFEIATAMQKGKKVIPVLVNSTLMPVESALPETIKDLHKLQAVRVDSNNFEMDVFNLSNAIIDASGKRNEYADMVRDFVAGKLKKEDLVKPDTNVAYSFICMVIGVVILLLNLQSPGIVAVCIAIIALGAYGYSLSRKVQPAWLSKDFITAKKNARNTKLISIITPVSGVVICVIIVLAEMLSSNLLGDINDVIAKLGKASLVEPVSEPEKQAEQKSNAVVPEPTNQSTAVQTNSITKSVKAIPASSVQYEYSNEYYVLENSSIYNQPDIYTLTDYFLYEGSVVEWIESSNGFAHVNFQDDVGEWFSGWIDETDLGSYEDYIYEPVYYVVSQNTYLYNSPSVFDITEFYLLTGTSIEVIEVQYPFAHVNFLHSDGLVYNGWIDSEHIVESY